MQKLYQSLEGPFYYPLSPASCVLHKALSSESVLCIHSISSVNIVLCEVKA